MLRETTIIDTLAATTPIKEKSAPIRQELTVIAIKNLAVPAAGQKTYIDSSVESFGVRVSAGGAKTFIVQGRVKGAKNPTRLRIGRVNSMSLKEAAHRQLPDGDIVPQTSASRAPTEGRAPLYVLYVMLIVVWNELPHG
ncbi:MAG TPA: Arm DNA-binding domain-containing protein [Burkholderiales bacterium]|nr:Arm DNA-binding domain-containing protein [Burkholderiales bacterium]